MFPSVAQLLIVLAVVLLIFGASRLPKISGDIGKSIKSFKKGIKEGDEEVKQEVEHKTNEEK